MFCTLFYNIHLHICGSLDQYNKRLNLSIFSKSSGNLEQRITTNYYRHPSLGLLAILLLFLASGIFFVG